MCFSVVRWTSHNTWCQNDNVTVTLWPMGNVIGGPMSVWEDLFVFLFLLLLTDNHNLVYFVFCGNSWRKTIRLDVFYTYKYNALYNIHKLKCLFHIGTINRENQNMCLFYLFIFKPCWLVWNKHKLKHKSVNINSQQKMYFYISCV